MFNPVRKAAKVLGAPCPPGAGTIPTGGDVWRRTTKSLSLRARLADTDMFWRDVRRTSSAPKVASRIRCPDVMSVGGKFRMLPCALRKLYFQMDACEMWGMRQPDAATCHPKSAATHATSPRATRVTSAHQRQCFFPKKRADSECFVGKPLINLFSPRVICGPQSRLFAECFRRYETCSKKPKTHFPPIFLI